MNEVEGRERFMRELERFIALRVWQDHRMPIYGSFIGFDLILFLAKSKFLPSPYSLKDVFHSLNYSEGALRIFIRRLEKEGWIKLDIWQGDRRNKKIIISDRLFEVVSQYFEYLSHDRAVSADMFKQHYNFSDPIKQNASDRQENEK